MWSCLQRAWFANWNPKYSNFFALQEPISLMFYVRFFRQYPFDKKFHSQTVIREKLQEALSYKKRVRNMLMKLITGVNFICTNFSYKCCFFYIQVTRENNVRTKNSYVRKIRTYKVDEIDYRPNNILQKTSHN